MLSLERPTPLAWRILGTAVAGSLLLQLAVAGGTLLPHDAGPLMGWRATLLTRPGSLADVGGILTTNLAWLAAIMLLSWPIARLWSWGLNDTWDPAWVNLVARVVYPGVALALVVSLWWIFSGQALTLSETLSDRWALAATAAHGTPELTALLLPLAAALSCIRAPAPHPGGRLLRAVGVSLPLLVCAALIEVYVSPRLLAPLAG